HAGMNYPEFRDLAQTGDLILTGERGLIGTLVRILTASQASHVGVLLWIGGGLWLAEMRSGGFTLAPASGRVREMAAKGQVYWGQAPQAIRWRVDKLRAAALAYRGRPYSWWTLLMVFVAQILRRR